MTRNIKLFLILFFGLLVFFVLLEGLKKPNKYSPDGNKVKIDFNLKFTNLYDNKEISFGDTIKDENYILINIWASWCLPCREEHNYLMKIKNKNIKIIGINYKDKVDSAKKFINDLGNPYSNVLIDRDGTKSIQLGAIGVPETYIFQKSSMSIIKRYIGPLDSKKTNEIRNIIDNE